MLLCLEIRAPHRQLDQKFEAIFRTYFIPYKN